MNKAQRTKVKTVISIVLFSLAVLCFAAAVVLDVVTMNGASIKESYDGRYETMLSNGAIGAVVMAGAVCAVISLILRTKTWLLIADLICLALLIGAMVVPIVVK